MTIRISHRSLPYTALSEKHSRIGGLKTSDTKPIFSTRVGQAAFSIQGRDKGRYYIITKEHENYALCVNGDERKLDNPKKKNIKHLKLMRKTFNIRQEDNYTDAENAAIRKLLKSFEL